MVRNFTCEPHFMMKAVTKAGISFPISKADALAKAGDLEVKVDFDKYVTLRSILERMVPEYYDNATFFYSAYMAAQTKELKKQFHY